MAIALKTLGFDNEYFIVNSDYVLADPRDVTRGTKQEPEPIRGTGITLQQDGAAIEVGTQSPINPDAQSWNDECIRTWHHLIQVVSSKGFDVFDEVNTTIPEAWLSIPEIAELGCEPDYNAYTAAENPKPPAEVMGRARTTGRHIHLGLVNDDGEVITPMQMLEVVKCLDITVGHGSIGHRSSQHRQRARWYGMAGSFRPKEYGLEYRVPCYNFLVNPLPIFNAITDAVDLYNSGDLEELIALKGGEERIRSLIDEGDCVLSGSSRSSTSGRGARVRRPSPSPVNFGESRVDSGGGGFVDASSEVREIAQQEWEQLRQHAQVFAPSVPQAPSLADSLRAGTGTRRVSRTEARASNNTEEPEWRRQIREQEEARARGLARWIQFTSTLGSEED